MLVQSGKPVGVFRTHADAPRVLIANSNLVPHWAHFNELDRKGLAIYGQMTAGSWIYIGSQGIVQGTYETLRSGQPRRTSRPSTRPSRERELPHARLARSLLLKALVEVAGRSTSDTPITGMRERDRAGRTAATGGTHAPTLASETPR